MSAISDRRTVLQGFGAAAILGPNLWPGVAAGQSWPSKPLTLLVGFSAGGAIDVISRNMADRLSRRIGQSVIVENRTGATGAVAAQAAARASSDGHTLITLAGPVLYPQPVPRVGSQLQAVSLLARGPMIIAGAPRSDIPDFRSVLARAKDEPEKWSYGTAGLGSSHHLVGEFVNFRAGVRMVHIPYRGAAQAVNDALAGQIPLVIVGAGALISLIQGGKLKGYAVTSSRRFAALPDIPSLAELDIGDADLQQWFGLATTSGVSDPIVEKINAGVKAVMAEPDMQEHCERLGMTASATSPGEFTQFFEREDSFYQDLQKKMNIKIN